MTRIIILAIYSSSFFVKGHQYLSKIEEGTSSKANSSESQPSILQRYSLGPIPGTIHYSATPGTYPRNSS